MRYTTYKKKNVSLVPSNYRFEYIESVALSDGAGFSLGRFPRPSPWLSNFPGCFFMSASLPKDTNP